MVFSPGRSLRSFFFRFVTIVCLCAIAQGCGGDRSGSNAGAIGKIAIDFSFVHADGTAAKEGQLTVLASGEEQDLIDGKTRFILEAQIDLTILAEVEGIEEILPLGPAFEDTAFRIQVSKDGFDVLSAEGFEPSTKTTYDPIDSLTQPTTPSDEKSKPSRPPPNTGDDTSPPLFVSDIAADPDPGSVSVAQDYALDDSAPPTPPELSGTGEQDNSIDSSVGTDQTTRPTNSDPNTGIPNRPPPAPIVRPNSSAHGGTVGGFGS